MQNPVVHAALRGCSAALTAATIPKLDCKVLGGLETASGWLNVDNSLAAGRRLASQVVLAQAAAAVVAGLLFWIGGATSGIAALAGGLLVALGNALLALRVFRPSLARGSVAMWRFALGTLLKWLVVLGGLFLILVRLRLPLVPALVGAGAATLVNWLALRFDA